MKDKKIRAIFDTNIWIGFLIGKSLSNANYLVTGDKDLLDLNEFMTARILTPVDFEKFLTKIKYIYFTYHAAKEIGKVLERKTQIKKIESGLHQLASELLTIQ